MREVDSYGTLVMQNSYNKALKISSQSTAEHLNNINKLWKMKHNIPPMKHLHTYTHSKLWTVGSTSDSIMSSTLCKTN